MELDEKRMMFPSMENEINLVNRRMTFIGAESADEATRSVEAIISTGTDVERLARDGSTFIERLEISPDAVRLGRLNAGAPLLDAHDRFSGISAIIGAAIPGSGRIENGNLVAKFKFSSSELGTRAFRDVADGIIRNVSVGYEIHKVEIDEEVSPPVHRVLDWEIYEVSAVGIPADAGAQFRSKKMTKKAVVEHVGSGEAATQADEKDAVTRGDKSVEKMDSVARSDELLAAERVRASTISDIGGKFGA
ncbi:MAG: HK97 family phage prohead protease, partial [Acidobacteria bacterium]|nr:HK97 family phage prohead protease [Acidobacteriota bacterium]